MSKPIKTIKPSLKPLVTPEEAPKVQVDYDSVIQQKIYEDGKEPPMNLEWLKVTAGDSLEEIAYDYGWQSNQLLIHNWGTTETAEVNWYLHNYIGCHEVQNGKFVFTGDERPGMILVPKLVDKTLIYPPNEVNVHRKTNSPNTPDSKATLDNRLMVRVMEALPDGSSIPVSGKWLYVFSGPDIDFGIKDELYDYEKEKFDFPGYNHLNDTKQPDRVEHEILITPEKPLTSDQKDSLFGPMSLEKSKFEYGNEWYFLSDHKFLENIKNESRDTREITTENYIHRKFKTIQIDIGRNNKTKRFYFLLSPVRLGPKAIHEALIHPNGLTPLLKSSDGKGMDSKPAFNADKHTFGNKGPEKAEDIKQNPIDLSVIDPYNWADYIANKMILDAIADYDIWLKTKEDSAVTAMTKKTKTNWTLTHVYVAQMLNALYNSYPDKNEISEVLNKTWQSDLKLWEELLNGVSQTKLYQIHKFVLQLTYWLNSPAHNIIETAILKDIDPSNPLDGIDNAVGLTHWGVCVQGLFGTQPGIEFLNDACTKSGSVMHDRWLNFTKDFHTDGSSPNTEVATVIGWRLANLDILYMDTIADLVTYKPTFAPNISKKEKWQKLAEDYEKKRDKLIKLFNDNKVFPDELKATVSLTELKSSVWDWDAGTAALVSTLDLGDKFTGHLFDHLKEKISQKMEDSLNVNDLAAYNEYKEKHNRIFNSKITNGITWTLKGLSFGIAAINGIKIMKTIFDGGWSSVSNNDKASALVSFYAASYDLVIEIGKIKAYKNSWVPKAFPDLEEALEARAAGAFGKAAGGWRFVAKSLAGLNAVAMIVSGITTIISMRDDAHSAYSKGDYKAETFYKIGAVGGLVTVAGGAYLGLSLITAGSELSIAAAPIGLFLITVGGLISLIAGLLGGGFESDDYVVFARKCFLGVEGQMNPRFRDDPPSWSFAPKEGDWMIDDQKKALIGLLSRFSLMLKLDLDSLNSYKEQMTGSFQGDLNFYIKPGFIIPGTTIEVRLYYASDGSIDEKKSETSSATLQWIGGKGKQFWNQTDAANYILLESKGSLFAVEKTIAVFSAPSDTVTDIFVNVRDIKFKAKEKNGKTLLLARVTVGYPGLKYTIRTDDTALTYEPDYRTKDGYLVSLNPQQVTSEIL